MIHNQGGIVRHRRRLGNLDVSRSGWAAAQIAASRAEVAWIENTLSALEENTMQAYDIKKDRKDIYAPKSGDFEMVEVPPLDFLMVDDHGDPNTLDPPRGPL